MNIFKYIKCLFVGHDVSGNESIIKTFLSYNWIKRCNCCGRYIMHGAIGGIDVSENEALKYKKEFDEMMNLYKNVT